MADVSKITLPSGNSYDIKDAVARAAIAALNSWEYVLCTEAANTPKDVTWDKSGTTITGTLIASADTMYKIYLVPDHPTSTKDIYEEYITINTTGTTYIWEKMGDTDIDLSVLGNFAYADTGSVTIKPKGKNSTSAVTFTGGTTDKVLGEATTFTNAASAVSFGEHTKETVIKTGISGTVPKTTSTKKYVKATASGTAIDVATSGTAVTALGDPTTETFVKSYPGASSKLVTTSITGVGSTTTTASKATAGTAKDIAKTGTAVNAVTSFAAPAQGNVGSLLSSATVENEVLSFGSVNPSTTSITPAVSNGTITPYTFEDVTVPVKNSSSTTVATGSLASNGGGASVMTGLGTPSTSAGVTGYTPSTDTFAKTVSVTSQPTVSLAAQSSSATGAVQLVTAVSTSGTDNVTFDYSTADAITALGAAEAAAQSITVGTNDKVTAVTGIGTGTAAAQTFTGTQETYTVNPTS